MPLSVWNGGQGMSANQQLMCDAEPLEACHIKTTTIRRHTTYYLPT